MKTIVYYKKNSLNEPFENVLKMCQFCLCMTLLSIVLIDISIHYTSDTTHMRWLGYPVIDSVLVFAFFIAPMILHLVMNDIWRYMELGEETDFDGIFKILSYDVVTKNIRLEDRDKQIMVCVKLDGVENKVLMSMETMKRSGSTIHIVGKQRSNKRWRYIYDIDIKDIKYGGLEI